MFGKFDPSYCDFFGPTNISVGPINLGDSAYEGELAVIVPYLSNDDAASMEDGNDGADAVWPMIESYEQQSERRFIVTLSADAPETPADCSGDGACDCYDVAL